MDQEPLINLTPNIIQDFIDLKIAIKSELNYLKGDLKSFFIDYLDPKLKYKNTYIDSQAIRIENNIHKEIVNLEKRIEKLNIIIEKKVLTKDNKFYQFYCDLLNIYENIRL